MEKKELNRILMQMGVGALMCIGLLAACSVAEWLYNLSMQ